MELSGKIIAVLEKRSGTSARTGNTWAVQEYVVETHDQYPRKCMFNVFGEDKINTFNIQVGEEVTVSFDIDAREYNGRWYNDIRAWNVTKGVAAPAPQVAAPAQPQMAAPAQPVAQPVQQATSTADPFAGGDASGDDLPF